MFFGAKYDSGKYAQGAKCPGEQSCVSQMHTYHNYQHIWFKTNKFQLMPMQTLEEIVAIDLGKNHG